jgi:dethiobiotin synthetase
MSGWFITGTDTDCGKTLVSTALVRKLRDQGQRVAVMKPVASGCARTADGLRNDDALTLLAASGQALSYEQVNPYAFEPAIAPHIAAQRAGVRIDAHRLCTAAAEMRAAHDCLLVEGAGGWRVPLTDGLDMAGLAAALELPVILVVGMRLGCINHALLTAQAIERDGCRLVGWVANRVDPRMAEFDANVATLRSGIGAPCLGVLPYLPQASDKERAAGLLSLP